ncbi:hypothetical protein ACFUJT_10010 [Streptomyces griseoincarnatus]
MTTTCETSTEARGPHGAGLGHPRLLPWLLLAMGAFSSLFQGTTPNPWAGAAGLLAFNSVYVYLAFTTHPCGRRDAAARRVALGLLAAVTCALAVAHGGDWLLFFPLLGLATGVVLRGRPLLAVGAAVTAVTAVAGWVSWYHDGWGGPDTREAPHRRSAVGAVPDRRFSPPASQASAAATPT